MVAESSRVVSRGEPDTIPAHKSEGRGYLTRDGKSAGAKRERLLPRKPNVGFGRNYKTYRTLEK